MLQVIRRTLWISALAVLTGCAAEPRGHYVEPSAPKTVRAVKGRRRRCKPDPWLEEERAKDLQKFFGDDWKIIRDKIYELWEELLRIAETNDRQAFADLLTYPITFSLYHDDSDMLWEFWTLRSKEEAKHVFGATFNALTKKNFKEHPLCDAIFMHSSGGRLFFFNGEFYCSVKKVMSGPNGNYFYTFTPYSLHVSSNDFSNDIGRIRYGLKRKGTRSPSRSSP